MLNTNPVTGIRYGVIAGQSLHPEVLDQLMWGAQAVNTSYEAAFKDAQARADSDAAEEAGELGFVHGSPDWDDFVEQRVESMMEQFSDTYRDDEDNYSGELDGVTYSVTWLGGAPIVFIEHGPDVVKVRDLCSPCVPNAGNLDSGLDPDGYECYGAPFDWLDQPETIQLSFELTE